MRILAIETSCDETAAAVVEDGWKVLSNVIASSLDLHKQTGGVVPEVAARAHVEAIIPVVEQALSNAFPGLSREDQVEQIDEIAVTKEPGLITSLLVGTETAKWFAYLWEKPLIPVNHIRGHVYANWLERDPGVDPIEFPVVCLSVSGGHNELILLRSHNDQQLLGESRDDAAGEAFDKVARILGLGYPGGPEIETMASKFQISPFDFDQGKIQIEFPRAWLNQNQSNKWDGTSFDFSFSGLKSEVHRLVSSFHAKRPPYLPLAEIAFAFQDAVCDVLVTKLIGAAKQYQAKEIHLAGGVSANKYLRQLLESQVNKLLPTASHPKLRWPSKLIYCTDNAAMIGGAAYFQYKHTPPPNNPTTSKPNS